MSLTQSLQISNSHLSDEDPDVAFKLFGVLELADMLRVDPLKEKIIARIKRDWPTSVKAWDERNSFYAIRNTDQPEDYRYPEPCSVIRLARSFDLDIPRHILFFDLSNRDPLIDFGVPFEGLDYVYGLGARWDLISPEYRKIAAVGNRKMVDWFENRETRCRDAYLRPSCGRAMTFRRE